MTNQELTQQYSTWGDKLLQHCDVLEKLQSRRALQPITVQLAPTEQCDSRCTYCSVASRPNGKIPFDQIVAGLEDFRKLGAKSVEITGGGNPLLYRDGDKRIVDVVHAAHALGYKVGVITNSEDPTKYLGNCDNCLDWVRVSLAKLDDGLLCEDYRLSFFRPSVGLSYIVNERTTGDVIHQIRKILSNWSGIKFVRVAPDCTTDDSTTIEEKWGAVFREVDPDGKLFIKEIGENYKPFPHSCHVGLVRPYWTSTGIYICTSHVLKTRKYEPEWRLCGWNEIRAKWMDMLFRLQDGLPPYEIDIDKCWHCYYYNNNQLLHNVLKDMPDKDFA